MDSSAIQRILKTIHSKQKDREEKTDGITLYSQKVGVPFDHDNEKYIVIRYDEYNDLRDALVFDSPYCHLQDTPEAKRRDVMTNDILQLFPINKEDDKNKESGVVINGDEEDEEDEEGEEDEIKSLLAYL